MRGQDVKWREYIRKRWVSEKSGGGGGHKNQKEKSNNKNIERRE